MKKTILLLLSFLFFYRFFMCPEISFAVSVKDLYPVAKVYNTVTKAYSIPALLEATGNVAKATLTAPVLLDLTKQVALGTGIALLAAGIYWGGGALYDYLAANEYSVSGGVLQLTKHVSSQSPINCALLSSPATYHQSTNCPAEMMALGGGCASGGYVHTTTCGSGQSNTFRFCQVVADWHTCSSPPPITYDSLVPATNSDVSSLFTSGLNNATGPTDPAIAAIVWSIDRAGAIYPHAGQTEPNIFASVPTLETLIHTIMDSAIAPADSTILENTLSNTTTNDYADKVGASAATDDQISAAISAALQSQGLTGTGLAAAIAAANAALQSSSGLTATQIAASIASALANSNGLTAAQIAAAIAAAGITAGLTQAQATAAVAAGLVAAGVTPAAIAAAIHAANPSASAADIATAIHAANPAITQDQAKTAVKEGLKDVVGTDDAAVPVDPEILLPTKLSLTTILSGFMTTINSLPMMTTLHGLAIHTAGNSNLCLDLPSNLGGQKCYDCAHYQASLDMVGNVFLGLTTVFSFLYIFKG